MSVMNINKANFQSEVLESKEPVLIDFWASWCGPCKMFAPTLDEFEKTASGMKVGKINVDEEMELARKYRVLSIPTIALFKDGQLVKSQPGAKSLEELKAWVEA